MRAFIIRLFILPCLFSPALAAAVTPMVAAGEWHTVALTADGTVLTWGFNGFGQLGEGTATDRSSPVKVTGLTGVVALAAGEGHTVALKADGTVLAWGKNFYGQLGDGTTRHRNSPVVAVPGLTGVVAQRQELGLRHRTQSETIGLYEIRSVQNARRVWRIRRHHGRDGLGRRG